MHYAYYQILSLHNFSHFRAKKIAALHSRLPPKVFLPLNIVGAIIWALIFTTLGYLGGEAIGPWLHHLDAHLKHWIWLILAVALVVAAHWWLKRREAKKKE